MAKEGLEEGPMWNPNTSNADTQRTGERGDHTQISVSIEDTQKMNAVRVDRVEKEPIREAEPKSPPKVNIIANIIWFFIFVGLMWVSDVAGEAFPTPIDDMLYDAAIATLFGILASFGIFTKRK